MPKLKNQILDLSRQNQRGPLSPWFDTHLTFNIHGGRFLAGQQLEKVSAGIIERLASYRRETGLSAAILGMSGGVDSALTAALYKRAGWKVIGITMPIHQVPEETMRGIEACNAIGIEHRHLDLSQLYDAATQTVANVDANLIADQEDPNSRIRRGNIRARLRMIALYNLASAENGIVASTDNLSELGAGFFTINGDVGDVSPIQALLKSWEVPYLSMINDVPETTYRAVPTDGNGVMDGGDEAQLGATYLQWDIMTFSIADAVNAGAQDIAEARSWLAIKEGSHEDRVLLSVTARMKRTWFKRTGTIKFPHPLDPTRYEMLQQIDKTLFIPEAARIS